MLPRPALGLDAQQKDFSQQELTLADQTNRSLEL
jgi:hypothetical protein